MSEYTFDRLKQKVIDHWADIRETAATVLAPHELIDWLRVTGGPTDAETLGLDDQEVALAVKYAYDFRNRFTVMKLNRMLGVPMPL